MGRAGGPRRSDTGMCQCGQEEGVRTPQTGGP